MLNFKLWLSKKIIILLHFEYPASKSWARHWPSTHGLLPASAELRTGRASLPLALTMRWLLAS
jgi:hypothetical protein